VFKFTHEGGFTDHKSQCLNSHPTGDSLIINHSV